MSQLDPQLNKVTLARLWEEITNNSGMASIPLSDVHSYFTNKFGKDKSSKSGSVVERAVAKIIERSGGGLKGLQRLVKFSILLFPLFLFLLLFLSY